ncbi:MAG: outer membrane beta-barrel protein [Candidatus Omnitrophica bacterium]|nr:outer membrane beta-barrel protein [Candidatus Omnitrophota bacterium]
MRIVDSLFASTLFLTGVVVFGIVSNASAENRNYNVRGLLTTTYDDNVTLTHVNTKADVIETIGVGLDIKREGTRNHFLGQIDVFRNFFVHNSDFDNTAIILSAKDAFEISSRMRFNVSESFERSQEPRNFEDAFGRNTGRYQTNRYKLFLTYEFDISNYALFQWTYGNEMTSYSRADLNDSTRNEAGARIQYAFDHANRAGLKYEFAIRSFESDNQIANNALIVDYGHNFTKQLQLVLKVGADFINSDISGSTVRGRYEVGLLNDIDEITRAGLSYKRGLNSESTSQDLFDSYRFTGSVGRELMQRIAVFGTAFYGKGEYQQSQVENKLVGAGAGVNYELFRNAIVKLTYDYSQTISNQVSSSYHRNVVGLQTQVKF